MYTSHAETGVNTSNLGPRELLSSIYLLPDNQPQTSCTSSSNKIPTDHEEEKEVTLTNWFAEWSWERIQQRSVSTGWQIPNISKVLLPRGFAQQLTFLSLCPSSLLFLSVLLFFPPYHFIFLPLPCPASFLLSLWSFPHIPLQPPAYKMTHTSVLWSKFPIVSLTCDYEMVSFSITT